MRILRKHAPPPPTNLPRSITEYRRSPRSLSSREERSGMIARCVADSSLPPSAVGSARLGSAFIPLEVTRSFLFSFFAFFLLAWPERRAITRRRESSSRSLFLSAVAYRTSCGQRDRKIRLLAECRASQGERIAPRCIV